MQHLRTIAFALAMVVSGSAQAAPPAALPPEEAYGYTRYELLAPGSGKFRIIYDITETRAGATAFFNPIRKGSVSTDESVIDRATSAPLPFKVVSGADAKTEMPRLDPTYDYIRVALARPVPTDGGEGRIRILKTYEDKKSYYQSGDTIVFDRSLGIKRNAVVLPKGYGLVACNYPSQVEQEADGRHGLLKPVAERRGDGHHEEDVRQRHQRVGDAVGREVEPLAEEDGGDAERRADDQTDRYRLEGGQHRQPGAGHQPAEHVPAEVVRAQQVLQARPLVERVGVDGQRVLRSQHGAEQRQEDHHGEDDDGDLGRRQSQHGAGADDRGSVSLARAAHAPIPSFVR